MDTGRQLLHQVDGQHYIKPIQHILAGFKNFDSPTEKKLACHPDLPYFACMFANREHTAEAQQAVGDLIVIAFYFLLRVGEYTSTPRRKKKARTRQFREMDESFFVKTNTGMLRLLPRTATAAEIMAVDAAIPRISN